MPGTATTSSPRTTSGQASRSERGTFASTKTPAPSCARPASRSPARQPRTCRPGPRRLDASTRPSAPALERRRARARARRCRTRARATTPPPRSTRFEPSREASSSSERPLDGRGQARAVLGAGEDVPLGGRVEPPRAAGRISLADQAARRVRVRGVDAERRGPRRGSTPRSPRARRSAADARRRRRGAADPARRPARRRAGRGRLDLVGGGVARRAQPAGGDGVAQVAQLGLGRARRRASTTSAPSTLGAEAASSSDSSPRSPWFTWSAETR